MKNKIDIHTHLFNLKYLPISAIIQRYAKAYIGLKLKILADGAERTLLNLMKDERLGGAKSWEQIKNSSESDLLKDLAQRVTYGDYYDPIIQKALSELESENEEGDPLLEEDNYSEGDGFLDISKSSIANDEVKIAKIFRLLKKLLCDKELKKKLTDGCRWIRFMMNSEIEIYKQLNKTYGDKVNIFVNHLLAADVPFGGTSTFAIEEQVDRMVDLQKISGNKIITFVQFDPHDLNGLDVVAAAIEKGCRGVKFYPSFNYRAFQNEDKEMDDRILEMFKYCTKNQTPIFTHCTPTGFESIPKKSGNNCNPLYWKRRLEANPELRNIKLCFGHAGGVKGWFAPIIGTEKDKWENTYASMVYELCITYPNIYCGVGFLSEIFAEERRVNFRNRLKKFLLDEDTNFKNKVIYGSDWHILFYEGIERNYLEQYETLFDEMDLDNSEQYSDLFFYKNALRFLGIKEEV